MGLRRRLRIRGILPLAAALQILAAAIGVSILALPAATNAVQTVPYMVNFQGRLADNSGNILSDGYYNIKFRLFNAATGGTNEWEGDRVYGTSDHRVHVVNGLFNIQFGDTTQGDPALTPAMFAAGSPYLYLEVELPTPASATCASNGCAVWTEGAMTPRQPLASSPYAINSDTLDGLDSSALGQLSAANIFTGANQFTPTAGVAITIKPVAATDALNVENSGGTLESYFDANGSLNVGQLIQPTTNNAIDLGTSGVSFRTGYFGTSVQTPALNATTSGGTITTNLGTLQRVATGTTTIDLKDAANTTLSVINSGGGVAGISADGGLTIGAAQVITVGAAAGEGTTCVGSQVLSGVVVTGGVVTGGTCVSAGGGDQLDGEWTSISAGATVNQATTVQFTGVANSSPSFNNVTHVLTLPSNTSRIVVETKGGGGGGGAVDRNTSAIKGAGGGGEGAYSKVSIVSSLASNYYFTVGGGGAGGASAIGAVTNGGVTGNASCFGSNAAPCTTPQAEAVGGVGGVGVDAVGDAAGGAGGAAASGVGDVTLSGATGLASTTVANSVNSGAGGGQGGGLAISAAVAAGNSGTSGGGGSGALTDPAAVTDNAGGNGGNGYVTITAYVTVAGTGNPATLQTAYNNTLTAPDITLASSGLTVDDSLTGVAGPIFAVQDNTGSTNYLAVTSSGISTSGTATVGSFAAATSVPVCSNAGTLSSCNSNPSSVTLQQAYAAGNAISTTGNDISDTLNSSQNFTVATAAGATGGTVFSLTDGSNPTPPAQLVLVKNNDISQALGLGVSVQSAAGTITTAFDASGANITNALAIGANAISGTHFSVANTGAITGVGLNAGTGSIQGTGGIAINGASTIAGTLGSVTNLTLSGTISGGTTYAGSGNINTTGGTIQTNSTDRITNTGSLTNIGQIGASYTSAVAANGQTLAYTNNNGGAGIIMQGINITPTNATGTSSGTNVLNGVNFAAGTTLLASDNTNGINFASATGYTNFIDTPTAVLTSGGALTGLTGVTLSSGNISTPGSIQTTGSGNIATTGTGNISSATTVTGITLNGTTGINTGAGAGTNRIDVNGNLVNIGNITGTGALTLQATAANLTLTSTSTGAISVIPGTGGITTTVAAGSSANYSSTAVMTADQLDQTDTSAADAPTADGINLLQQTFFAKPATGNTESSSRINITNSNTVTAGQVNGLRIVATGAGSAINSVTDGIYIDPLASASTGTTNQNAIQVGANWNNILDYNGTTPIINGVGQLNGGQLEAVSVANGSLVVGTFSSITGTGALSVGSIASGFGTIATANTISTSNNIFTTGTGTITSATSVNAATAVLTTSVTSPSYTGSGAVTLQAASGSNLTLASAGASAILVNPGTNGMTTTVAANSSALFQSTAVSTADQIDQTNTAAADAPTANGVNLLQQTFFGAPATGNEQSATRINVTNSNAGTAGQLNGLRIVAVGAGGAVNSITDGITVDPLTNASTGTTQQNALSVGTGWNNVLSYNGTTVINGTGQLNASQIGTGSGVVSLVAGAAAALTVTGNAASTWSTTAGLLTVQSGSGELSLGTTTSVQANGALTVESTGANALTLATQTSGANVDISPNGTGTVVIGGTTPTLTSTAAVTLAAGGTAQNVNITPTTTGAVVIGGTTPTLTSAGSVTLQAGGAASNVLLTPSTSGVVVVGGTAPEIESSGATALKVDTGGAAALDIGPTNATSIVIGGNAAATIKEEAANSSAAAYTLQTQAGTALLVASDNSTVALYVGGSTAVTTPVLLVLGSKSTTGDPTGVAGSEYYNSTNNVFRCAQGGTTFQDCIAPSNESTADQAVAAATTAYLTGSNLSIPGAGLKAGSQFKWVISVSKTAAGVAASNFLVKYGTTGTTTDATEMTFTGATETGAIDDAQIIIELTVRSVSATGTWTGNLSLVHNVSSGGFANTPSYDSTQTTGTFADNTAGAIIGLAVTTGAADVFTFQQVQVNASNL